MILQIVGQIQMLYKRFLHWDPSKYIQCIPALVEASCIFLQHNKVHMPDQMTADQQYPYRRTLKLQYKRVSDTLFFIWLHLNIV